MLKKIAFFVFTMALGCSYALAGDWECENQCFLDREACLDNGTPATLCTRAYRFCMKSCPAI